MPDQNLGQPPSAVRTQLDSLYGAGKYDIETVGREGATFVSVKPQSGSPPEPLRLPYGAQESELEKLWQEWASKLGTSSAPSSSQPSSTSSSSTPATDYSPPDDVQDQLDEKLGEGDYSIAYRVENGSTIASVETTDDRDFSLSFAAGMPRPQVEALWRQRVQELAGSQS